MKDFGDSVILLSNDCAAALSNPDHNPTVLPVSAQLFGVVGVPT